MKSTRAPARRSGDPVLIGAIVALVVVGLVVLASASSVTAFRTFGSSFAIVNRQIIALLLGAALFGFTASTEYHRWRAWSFILLVGGILLLIAVFLPGIGATLQGARRWISLGPLFFQPSELVKPALVLALALWLEREGGRELAGERAIPFLVPVAIVGGLILMQPDLGTVVVITVTAFTLYLAAGAPLKRVAQLLGVVVLLGAIAAAVQPYRLERLRTFIDPSADPQGAGYHVQQATAAIQSGGWFGKGYGNSSAKTGALPEPESDSIFAIAAEELGAVVAAGIIALYGILGIRGLRAARAAPDAFGRNVAIGITVGLVAQAFINIGALTGVLPLTGVPLPLISAGGSSLVITLASLGILVSIARAGQTSKT